MSGQNVYLVVLINFGLMVAWHLIVLLVCRTLPISFFDYNRFLYKPRAWEREGNFYVKKLKIKKWKDRLPQYVASGGFSKRNLNSFKTIDKKYLGRFISETCRAEWNHFFCCLYFAISFSVNSWPYSLIFSLIPIIANLPFLIIQRYNRLRLIKFYKKNFSEREILSEIK